MLYDYLHTITDNFYEFLEDFQISRQTLKNIKHFLNFKILLKIFSCVHKNYPFMIIKFNQETKHIRDTSKNSEKIFLSMVDETVTNFSAGLKFLSLLETNYLRQQSVKSHSEVYNVQSFIWHFYNYFNLFCSFFIKKVKFFVNI